MLSSPFFNFGNGIVKFGGQYSVVSGDSIRILVIGYNNIVSGVFDGLFDNSVDVDVESFAAGDVDFIADFFVLVFRDGDFFVVGDKEIFLECKSAVDAIGFSIVGLSS